MTSGLAKACETKSKLYKKHQRCKTHDSKIKFTTYRNKLRSLLQKAEKDYYSKQLDYYKNNAKKSWNLINHLIKKANNGRIPFSEFEIDGK